MKVPKLSIVVPCFNEEACLTELHGRLTEVGTIELWCSEVHGPRTWKLQFDVRSATQTDRRVSFRR